MRHTCKMLLAAAAIFLAAFAVSADTMQMKNGERIQGRYLGGSERQVQFESAGRVRLYPTRDVLSITFTDPRSTAAAAAPPAYPPPPPGPADYQPAPQADYAPPPAPCPPASAYQATPPPPPSGAGADYAAGYSAGSGGSYSGGQVIPAGTYLTVRMIDGVDSHRNRVGDRFHATLDADVVVGDMVLIPRGVDVYGCLSDARQAGNLTGRANLQLVLTDILVNGSDLPLVTGEYDIAGKARGPNTAAKAGGGAIIGAIIGGIAGGGKGAAIGAGVGAGAGASINIVTRGEEVRVPSETALDFRLEQPLALP